MPSSTPAVLRRLDDLMTYYAPPAGEAFPPDASGHSLVDLYVAGQITDHLLELLENVVKCVEGGGCLADDPTLFAAWLYAFELRASSRSVALGTGSGPEAHRPP